MVIDKSIARYDKHGENEIVPSWPITSITDHSRSFSFLIFISSNIEIFHFPLPDIRTFRYIDFFQYLILYSLLILIYQQKHFEENVKGFVSTFTFFKICSSETRRHPLILVSLFFFVILSCSID